MKGTPQLFLNTAELTLPPAFLQHNRNKEGMSQSCADHPNKEQKKKFLRCPESTSSYQEEDWQKPTQMSRFHEQPPNAAEQIAQIGDKLNQVKEILEAPEWSQEIYDKAMDLTSEIRGTIIAIFSNPTAKAKHRQQAQGVLLKESNRLATAANKRHRQYAFALQKQQRAHEKRQ
jgi:hypothetical protein